MNGLLAKWLSFFLETFHPLIVTKEIAAQCLDSQKKNLEWQSHVVNVTLHLLMALIHHRLALAQRAVGVRLDLPSLTRTSCSNTTSKCLIDLYSFEYFYFYRYKFIVIATV